MTLHQASDHPAGEPLRGRWRLDPRRSSVDFSARNFWGLMTVRGHFDDYQGRLDLSSPRAIELTIDAATVRTGNDKRDKHLRSADFFDAENHPRVQFVSDSVEQHDGTLTVHGRLSARGRSIPLQLDAQSRRVGDELEIRAATTASHRDLGMTWSPLRMIGPSSRLIVNAHLTRDLTQRSAGT